MLQGNEQITLNFDGEERVEEELYGLFHNVLQFKKSDQYLQYLKFIARFRKYSIFNTTLVFAQKPTVGYFATRSQWRKEFERNVKEDARPLVMLQPKGPVMFAYDIDDTEGDDHLIPERLLQPFRTSGELDDKQLDKLIDVLKGCYINLAWTTEPMTKGGQITRYIDCKHPDRPNLKITLNKAQSYKTNFVTLIHEIAHLLLGHLGNYDYAKWPSRMSIPNTSKEFEAESVAYVLAGRHNLKTLSNEYLAGYLEKNDTIPKIDIQQICKAISWIDEMLNGKKPRIYNIKEN